MPSHFIPTSLHLPLPPPPHPSPPFPPYLLQRFYKKAAAFVLRAVAKHSPELAQAVVDCGALDSLVICLEEFDPGVKEAAAWALGYIARHNGGVLQEGEGGWCGGIVPAYVHTVDT